MRKEFDRWNEIKKQMNARRDVPYCHQREVWWCALGINVGSEQDGSGEQCARPVLILKGLSAETCMIIPLTTAPHDHPLRPSVGVVGGKQARALLSQMRVIDTKRLIRKIEYMPVNQFREIEKAARDML